MGGFVGALQTLPGTSNVSEGGRLFVRGGDAEETQIFVDGMRVFTPYSPTAKNIPMDILRVEQSSLLPIDSSLWGSFGQLAIIKKIIN